MFSDLWVLWETSFKIFTLMMVSAQLTKVYDFVTKYGGCGC